ncbi:MAG: tetratricopeptide repeat protein [bacterium]|nr:tetratricopeptide repeat protein [bacterium]
MSVHKRKGLFFLVFVVGFLFSCSKKPNLYVKDKIYADDEVSLYFQAQYDITSGRLKQAEEKLEFLVDYAEKSGKSLGFTPYYDLAVLKFRLKKLDEAKIYTERLTLYVSNPREAEKSFYLFVRLGEQKRANDVIEYYFSKFPSDEDLFRIIVMNYIRQGNLQRVKDICEVFLSKRPNNLFATMIYGNVLKSLGDKENAKKQFEKIVKQGVYDEATLKELVDIYKEQGENKKAIDILKEADRINPSISIKRELVDFLLDEGMNDEAVDYMEEITRELREPEILFDWIRVLFRAKRYSDIVSNADSVRKVLSDKRASELISLMKAMSLHELGKFEEAYEEYSKFDEKSDFYADAIAGKIDALKEMNPLKAIEFIEQIDKDMITPQIAQSIVYVYREKEDYNSALKLSEDFEKRFESKRNSFIYTKAILLYESGKVYEALMEADKLLQENPSDPMYLNLKGYILCEYLRMESERTGKMDYERLEEAGKLISQALKIKPDPYIKDSMGWYLFLKGQIDEAEKYIREALAALPDDSILNEHLGDIILKKGDMEKSLELYKKALEKGKPKGLDRIRIENKIKSLTEKLKIKRTGRK